MLIIGEGGAGKTSLRLKILDPHSKLPDEKDTTRGIDAVKWRFPLEGGKEFQANIWDFGGQEVYHATHQFFLTQRSLYALVADTRKEDTDFYYWLNIVELLSDNSPVLIIKNEKGDRPREVNERQLRGEFTNIKEILATNLLSARGLSEVVDEIKHQISHLKHIGDPLPKTWVNVREALEEDSRNSMPVEEYFDLCSEHGIARREDQLQLSGYLHDLGICLHFQKDAVLKHFLILKPEWGTTAVYRVLDNLEVIKNHGRFSRDDLKTIWWEETYVDKCDELLQLMLNFKLCYLIPGTEDKYIAPQLLTDNKPEYTWDDTNNLFLRYRFVFMPKGVVTQLIVAMHKFITNQDLVWKSGAIFEDAGAKAEVVELYGQREIRIRVCGKNRRDLLTIVRHELCQILETYKRLKYDELIPCNCRDCRGNPEPHFHVFEALRKFVADGKEIQCPKSYTLIDPRALIDDVIDRRSAHEELEGRCKEGIHIERIDHVEQLVIQQNRQGENIVSQTKKESKANNIRSSWANGSFYLFVFLVVITALGMLARSIPAYALPLVLVAGLMFVPVIGAFQLKQDGRLSDKSFVQLIKIVMGQMPLIGKIFRSKPDIK